MNIGVLLVFVLEAILGVTSSVGVVLLLFGTIGFKLYRKLRYGISLFN